MEKNTENFITYWPLPDRVSVSLSSAESLCEESAYVADCFDLVPYIEDCHPMLSVPCYVLDFYNSMSHRFVPEHPQAASFYVAGPLSWDEWQDAIENFESSSPFTAIILRNHEPNFPDTLVGFAGEQLSVLNQWGIPIWQYKQEIHGNVWLDNTSTIEK